jgi:hypothetical protein
MQTKTKNEEEIKSLNRKINRLYRNFFILIIARQPLRSFLNITLGITSYLTSNLLTALNRLSYWIHLKSKSSYKKGRRVIENNERLSSLEREIEELEKQKQKLRNDCDPF